MAGLAPARLLNLMTIKAIAFCRGHHAVKHLNPVTYSAGVDVAGSPSASQTEPPSGWRRAIQIQPLPNLNATIDREAWVCSIRKISDLSILLATVNISRSEIWQKLPTLIRLLAAVGVVIYLS
jgi:hypothetical protein